MVRLCGEGRKESLEVILELAAVFDEQLLGGAIADLPIPATSNLILAFSALLSLMLSKATCIWAVTSAGKPSQTMTSLHWILARCCFNLFMFPNITAGV